MFISITNQYVNLDHVERIVFGSNPDTVSFYMPNNQIIEFVVSDEETTDDDQHSITTKKREEIRTIIRETGKHMFNVPL